MSSPLRYALITGASSGIGRALALLLAKEGFSLLLTGRDQVSLESLRSTLQERVIETLSADLASVEGRGQVIEWLRRYPVDLLVNNAGYGLYGDVIDLSLTEQLNMIEVNAKALMEITWQAAQRLKERHQPGVILNVSSLLSYHACPGAAVYAATKAFVSSFSEALDFELQRHHIRVLLSCPGQVDSAFAKRAAGKVLSPGSRKGPLLSVEEAAEHIGRQIQQQKAHVNFGFRAALLSWLVRHLLPQKFVKKRLHHLLLTRTHTDP